MVLSGPGFVGLLSDGFITEKKMQGLQNGWQMLRQNRKAMVHSKNQAAMQNSSQADKKGFRFWKTMQREQKKLLNEKSNPTAMLGRIE